MNETFIISYLTPVLTSISIASIVLVLIEYIKRKFYPDNSSILKEKIVKLDIKTDLIFDIKEDINNVIPKINTIYDSYTSSYSEADIDKIIKSLSEIGVINYQQIDQTKYIFGLTINNELKISYIIGFHKDLNAIRLFSFSFDIISAEQDNLFEYLLSENTKYTFAKIGILKYNDRNLIVIDQSVPYFENKVELKSFEKITKIIASVHLRIFETVKLKKMSYSFIDYNEYTRRAKEVAHRN